jgi:hypothetical protein
MIELKQYKYGDELKIDPVEHTLRGQPGYDERWKELILPEWTWTAYDGEKIVGVGGLIPYEIDAYAWVMLDREGMKRYRTIHIRTLRAGIRMAESYRFSRLWTYVQDGFDCGHRLAEFLGFIKGKQVDGCWLYSKELRWTP